MVAKTPVTEADIKVRLPSRYRQEWRQPFAAEIAHRLPGAQTILDVGSGRNPAILPEDRPSGVHYIGLDLSAEELSQAGPGAYDEQVVSDIGARRPELSERVDLAVSWQVFEHVAHLDVALEHLRDYLRPGGSLVSLFSGGLSAFALVGRSMPAGLSTRVVERVMRRRGSAQPAFPAYYDHCVARSLREAMSDWSEVRIHPFYRGANYFHFSAPLTRAYLGYENAVHRMGLENLATHYLLVARR